MFNCSNLLFIEMGDIVTVCVAHPTQIDPLTPYISTLLKKLQSRYLNQCLKVQYKLLRFIKLPFCYYAKGSLMFFASVYLIHINDSTRYHFTIHKGTVSE